MQKYISEQNLNTLLDTLIAEGTRVVAPRMKAGTPLYDPLTNSSEMITDQLPRRSAKEAFFPVCEDIMTYEKEGQKVTITDIDPARFPETVLVGVRPCDAVAIPVGYVGGVESLEDMESLMAEGFAFVQLGRATVRDPGFVNRLRSEEIAATDCDHCNRCVASMSIDGIRCYCAEELAASGAVAEAGL